MGSEWHEFSLSEVVELVIDNRGRNPKSYSDEGVPVIDNYLIKSDGEPKLEEVKRYIDEDTYGSFIRKYNQPGDVLLTLVGNGYGYVAISPQQRTIIIQNTIGLRCNEKFDNTFLYYLLKGNREYLMNLDRGAAQPSIKVGDVLDLVFEYPTLNEQKEIGFQLKQLDNKIQLNRQINQTLEQMAQALFKSWFVDFDPVIDNALAAGNSIPEELQARAQRRQQQLAKPDHQPLPDDVRQLFPSEFEETEALGWVPKGWESLTFEKICSSKQGKYIPKGDISEIYSSDFPYPVWGGNGIRGYAASMIYPEPLVVLTCRGSNCGLVEKTQGAAWVSNISFACRPKIGSANFLFVLFNNIDFNDCISGSAQPQITYTALKSKSINFPMSYEAVEFFSQIVDGYYSVASKNNDVSASLEKLRDTLLPKLISGELRLPDSMLDSETNPPETAYE
jgi:type I restriction enzyme S subunit